MSSHDNQILTGIGPARNVHLACFSMRYLAGVTGVQVLMQSITGQSYDQPVMREVELSHSGIDCSGIRFVECTPFALFSWRPCSADHSTINLPRSIPIWH